MAEPATTWYGLVQDVDKRGRPKGKPYWLAMPEAEAKKCSAVMCTLDTAIPYSALESLYDDHDG